MISDLETKLSALLFWDSPYDKLPSLDLQTLQDDRAVDTVGFSFLTNPHNGRLKVTWETLFSRVCTVRQRREDWFEDATARPSQNDDVQFRAQAVAAYENDVKAFLRLLLIAVHLTGGQPGRSIEVLSMRYKNTAEGGVRNVFLSQGQVVLATWNTKTSRIQSQNHVIYRFLPHRLSDVLVRYLAHVVPFVEFARELSSPTYDETKMDGPYIWGYVSADNEYRPWSGPSLSRCLRTESTKYLSTSVSVAQWRHLAIAITNRFLGNLATDVTVKKRKRDDAYGDESDGSDSNNDDSDNAYDAQASHSTRTASITYARLLFQGTLGTQHGQARYHQASTDWHNFLGVGTPGSARTSAVWTLDDDAETEQGRRQAALAKADLATGLSIVAGRGARFRGRQAHFLDLVVRGTSPLLWVAGTGSGKSVAFLIPAVLRPDGVTIVIVPLLALQGDLVRRCRDAQIRCAVWSSRNARPDATLVFCTPENASLSRFNTFVRQLVQFRQLDRVIYDECHVVLNSRDNFRYTILLVFRRLLELPVQQVWMTATLPPADEDDFFAYVNVSANITTIVREPTRRSTTAYAVERMVRPQDCTDRLRLLVEEARTNEQRTIVFCPSVAQAQRYATELDAVLFHAKTGETVEEKEAIVSSWANSYDYQPIVATSALGLGLNVPDVALVVHCGMPWTLRDFVQESGRAGRSGQRARSILLVEDWEVNKAQGNRPALYEYVCEQVCYRTALARHMDGVFNNQTCRSEEARCTLCQARADQPPPPSPSPPPPTELVVARTKQAALAERQNMLNKAAHKNVHLMYTIFENLAVRQETKACVFCSAVRWADPGTHHPKCNDTLTLVRKSARLLAADLRKNNEAKLVDDHCARCWNLTLYCQAARNNDVDCTKYNLLVYLLIRLYRQSTRTVLDEQWKQRRGVREHLDWLQLVAGDRTTIEAFSKIVIRVSGKRLLSPFYMIMLLYPDFREIA